MTESQSREKVGGKGRPTPKRREAERRRREPVSAPRNRKEAKAAAREARTAARLALRTGDERHLPPRDAGPVRRFVRDLVDARRNAGNYVLWAALGIVLTSTVANAVPRLRVLQLVVLLAYPAIFLWVIVDSFLLVRLVRRRVRETFPAEETKGLGAYAVLRTFQMRRLRLPPPKVKVGAKV